MNQKKAKLLRKLSGFYPNNPPEYKDYVVAKRKILQFNKDGSSEEIIKEQTQRVRTDEKAVYSRYKRAFYTLKSKGGHRFANLNKEDI